MTAPPRNIDFLAWFSSDERSDCEYCGGRTCVTLPDVAAVFCLGCGAVTIDGRRIDIDGSIAVDE